MPLQNVRGNFARIHSALNELLALSERTNEPGSDTSQLDLVATQLAVHDAVAMFQRQAQGLLQVCAAEREPLGGSVIFVLVYFFVLVFVLVLPVIF